MTRKLSQSETGPYNKDQELYTKLVNELYEKYPDGVTLPPEYASFVENDVLRLLIRLSRYKFVAKLLKKTDRVLEVGCGSGLGSIFLSQHCEKVVGLDVKKNEINEAKRYKLRENIRFEVGDFFDYSEHEKFDVIVNMDVIEHMPVEIGHELVQKASKLLNHTGLFVCGTPSIYSYPYQSALSQASHIKCYDRDELVELIENYFQRTLSFSMNDELVHTGFHKMAWYYFIIAFSPKIS